jgi:hypothetical protein
MKTIPITALVCFLLVAVASADDKFSPIDLQPYANKKLTDSTDLVGIEDNNLAALPEGALTIGKVRFEIGKSLIELSGKTLTKQYPEKVEGIKVDKTLAKLYILHAAECTSVPNRTLIGEYRVNFDDNSTSKIRIVMGEDVQDWWDWWADPNAGNHKVSPLLRIAWTGDNAAATTHRRRLCLFATTWENPWPDKKVVSIDYSSKTDVASSPFCVAITAETK